MKNWKKYVNKIGLVFFMVLAFGVLSCVEGYAATVGQVLTQPEAGWKRYDDTDKDISINEQCIRYSGQSSVNYDGGTFTSIGQVNMNSIMTFNFTGSKIRIIGAGGGASTPIDVYIDNVKVGSFDGASANLFHYISFEKTDLVNKEHNVRIRNAINQQNPRLNIFYYIDAIDIDANGELKPYNENVTTEEAITVESLKNKYKVGNEFTTDIVLHNGTNICAEDLKISYDKDLFEYIGIEQVEGIKTVKEFKDPANGQIRLITASLGKQNAVNGDKALVKLKFRGKKQGKGKVDVTKARIANNGTIEKDILVENCGEKEIEIEGIKDVNRTGEFTLLDLAVDGWYYGDKAENTDKTKFDADVVENGMIDDDDLGEIVNQMINNSNYPANK